MMVLMMECVFRSLFDAIQLVLHSTECMLVVIFGFALVLRGKHVSWRSTLQCCVKTSVLETEKLEGAGCLPRQPDLKNENTSVIYIDSSN